MDVLQGSSLKTFRKSPHDLLLPKLFSEIMSSSYHCLLLAILNIIFFSSKIEVRLQECQISGLKKCSGGWALDFIQRWRVYSHIVSIGRCSANSRIVSCMGDISWERSQRGVTQNQSRVYRTFLSATIR